MKSRWLRRMLEVAAVDATWTMTRTSCLVLAPHPDDEVLGCGGTIVRKVRHGAGVFIAFLTDGCHGCTSSADEARVMREKEARSAASVLGLPREAVTFHGFEDGRLGDHVAEATERVRHLVAGLRVDEIFVPWRGDSHADHRAAQRIGVACGGEGVRVYEYPIWYGEWLRTMSYYTSRLPGRPRFLASIPTVKIDVGEVVGVKVRAFGAHRSQQMALASSTEYFANLYDTYELFFLAQ